MNSRDLSVIIPIGKTPNWEFISKNVEILKKQSFSVDITLIVNETLEMPYKFDNLGIRVILTSAIHKRDLLMEASKFINTKYVFLLDADCLLPHSFYLDKIKYNFFDVYQFTVIPEIINKRCGLSFFFYIFQYSLFFWRIMLNWIFWKVTGKLLYLSGRGVIWEFSLWNALFSKYLALNIPYGDDDIVYNIAEKGKYRKVTSFFDFTHRNVIKTTFYERVADFLKSQYRHKSTIKKYTIKKQIFYVGVALIILVATSLSLFFLMKKRYIFMVIFPAVIIFLAILGTWKIRKKITLEPLLLVIFFFFTFIFEITIGIWAFFFRKTKW